MGEGVGGMAMRYGRWWDGGKKNDPSFVVGPPRVEAGATGGGWMDGWMDGWMAAGRSDGVRPAPEWPINLNSTAADGVAVGPGRGW